ncbi:MAG: hypothetical protein LBP68_07885, partial [Acidobacteriota bacterium]|nr:hypothetical protein [Acidobacteriota bacterium]
MRIKTFYAKSMADALNDIRETLGPDALLLTSKDLPRRAGAWGRSGGVEVVAAVDSPEGQEGIDVVSSGFQKLSENQKQLLLSYDTGKTDAGSHDTPRARRDIPSSAPSSTRAPNPAASREPVAAAMPSSSSSSPPSWRSGGSGNVVSIADAGADDIIKSRAAQKLCYDMVECGVDSDLARRMVSQAVSGLPAGKRRNRLALIAATSRLIPGVAAEDGGRGDLPQKRIVAFIGPTGVGKTTSISKLAAHLALGRNKKVILLSMDSYRIGAIEQLRSYAGLMGIPFRFVSDV